MIDWKDLEPRMIGNWEAALLSIVNLDRKVFSGKHGPCPHCMGKDRFRWDNHFSYKGDGGAYCNQCGAGSGLTWMMKISGMSFGETIRALGDWIGGVPVQKREAVRSQVMQKAQQEKYGSYVDHERCTAFLNLCGTKHLADGNLAAGIADVNYHCCTGRSGDELLCIPVSLCSQQDMICDIAFIKWGFYYGEKTVAFMSGGFPASGISVLPGNGEFIYLCSSMIDAWHTNGCTGAEVWCCWSPSNVAQVAYRMKTKKLRVSCLSDDMETLYAAEEANLDVITPRNNRWSMGIPKVLHKAEDLCAMVR